MSEQDKQPPSIYEGLVDARLTPEEIAALTERPDHGITPAPMVKYDDLEEFKARQNNFHITFTANQDSLEWHIYRGRKAFQRYEILAPDLATQATEQLRGKISVTFDEDDWTLLHEIYGQMSQLVDVSDPHVTRQGQPDEEFLCR